MWDKRFGIGNPKAIIELHPEALQVLQDCRKIGCIVEFQAGKVSISLPPPSSFRAFAYNLDEFVRQGRGVIQQRKKTGETAKTSEEAAEPPDVTIERLRAAGRTVINQREAWKARALQAEKALADLKAAATEGKSGDGRYRRLKNAIAHELHPDRQTDGIERLVKAEIFKVLWQRVEEIDRGD